MLIFYEQDMHCTRLTIGALFSIIKAYNGRNGETCMNTLHLKYAVEVEKTRSITQAADNLYMAQPNLSKAIRELEDSLGITIFERTPKGVVPTKKGSEFLVRAKKILAQLDKMEALRDAGDMELQRFDLAAPYGGYIMDAFARFAGSLSAENVQLSFREMDMAETIVRVAEERSDLGIVRCRTGSVKYLQSYLAQKELTCEPVWEFTGALLMAKNHPLASFGTITADSLAEYTELRRGQESAQDFFEEESSEAESGIRINGCAGAEALLSRIRGAYMIIPPAAAYEYDDTPLVQKAYREGLRYTDLLIYPKNTKLPELAFRFIDALYTAKNSAVFSQQV